MNQSDASLVDAHHVTPASDQISRSIHTSTPSQKQYKKSVELICFSNVTYEKKDEIHWVSYGDGDWTPACDWKKKEKITCETNQPSTMQESSKSKQWRIISRKSGSDH